MRSKSYNKIYNLIKNNLKNPKLLKNIDKLTKGAPFLRHEIVIEGPINIKKYLVVIFAFDNDKKYVNKIKNLTKKDK